MADVEEVRERVVRTDGIDEVSLQTLGDQDRRGHVALSQASQSGSGQALARRPRGPLGGQRHELGAEHRSAIFQTGDDRRGCDIAGHPRDKDVSETLVEDQLDGHPRIRARQDGGEGLLLLPAFSSVR